MDDTNRYTDDELNDVFDRLFPQGFAGADVRAALAPRGWPHGPLYALLHPSARTRYEEALRVHRNLAALRPLDAVPPPEPRRDDFIDEPADSSISEQEEIARLVGAGLWDLFSDNHRVTDADGRELDLGSFRSAGGWLADYCNRQIDRGLLDAGDIEARQQAMDDEIMKHMPPNSGMEMFRAMMKEEQTGPYRYTDFFMGTGIIASRGDLTPLYAMLFQRLKTLGCDWRYVYPRLGLVDVRPLKDALDAKAKDDAGEPEWANYDPAASFAMEEADRAKDAEIAETREKLDELYEQSVAEALTREPPTVVRAYELIYGDWPAGWPPEAEV